MTSLIIKSSLMIISFVISIGCLITSRKEDITNKDIIVSVIMLFIQINILIYVWGWL